MLGDDIASALPELQQQAESLMVDKCVITIVTSRALNELTLQHEDITATLYSGKCKVSEPDVQVNDASAAGQSWSTQWRTVSIPLATSASVRVGATVRITECPQDPALVDRRLTVRGIPGKTWPIQRRLKCQELTS